nr:hypothetical protein [Tanacetum cinerariifolium]
MSDLIRDKLVYQVVKEQRKDIKGQLMVILRSQSFAFLSINDKSKKTCASHVFKKYLYRLKPISWKIKRVIQLIGGFPTSKPACNREMLTTLVAAMTIRTR